MAAMITRDVVESYLSCTFKGFLKLTRQQGTKSDYETMIRQARAEIRLAAIETILARHTEEEVARDVMLTPAMLTQGALFICDSIFANKNLSLLFDGLRRVDGSSKLGSFHYVPMLFYEGTKVGRTQRTLLEVYAFILSRLQGRLPTSAIIWHGPNPCKATKVRLNPDVQRVAQLLENLKQAAGAESLPRLLLNDHCQIREFRQRCHDQAVQEDNISLLRGLGEKAVRNYAKKGIFTVTQLAHTFRPRKKAQRANQQGTSRNIALQALAVRDKRVYILGTPELQSKPVRIYLDMEGVPDKGFVYLIGMVIEEHGTEKHYSFWADCKEQERRIFNQCVREIMRRDDFLLFCYGAYEQHFIRRMRNTANNKKAVDRLLDSLVNILSLIYSHFFFPTYTNSLKEIGTYLGCAWSEVESSGTQSIAWRTRWENAHDDMLKRKLTTYNLEDCVALKKVIEFAYGAEKQLTPTRQASPDTAKRQNIATIEDIERLTDYETWGEATFAHPDFQHINNCSYFDYQRERVHARTRKLAKRRRKNRKKRWAAKLRVSKRVRLVVSKCPSCQSREIVEIHSRGQIDCPLSKSKKALDLQITPTSVRRKVIECRTSAYLCKNCGEAFVSDKYQRMDRYFHNLKSWVMYQHVVHRISISGVRTMLGEFFGLDFCVQDLHSFKSVVADYYRLTYRQLLRGIVSGGLVHIDETHIKLNNREKVYVWVLSNMEEVVFMYRPTREGAFLRELLKDFRGVVVSDFYAAYDSIDCPQQKCLIHLMRDMNQDLLANPFDTELQSLTRPFGVLLRLIIATIDKHGLKRSWLSMHQKDVDRFFRFVAEQSFKADAAVSLQARLLKYEGKLFAFMQHDNVPWNNNNAEHAIKGFAHYRQLNKGYNSVNGLKDYLVLLSIYQTCRYKGFSFLRFLLSRCKDIHNWNNKRRRGLPVIETYSSRKVPLYILHQQQRKAALIRRQESGGQTKDALDDTRNRHPSSFNHGPVADAAAFAIEDIVTVKRLCERLGSDALLKLVDILS